MTVVVLQLSRRIGIRNDPAMARIWLHFLATLLLAFAPLPVRAQNVTTGPCDDLAKQIEAISQELDQEQQNAQPLLSQATQMAPLVQGELTAAALQGAPGLTPDLASSDGAIAALVGTQIDEWRNSGASIRELPGQVSGWQSTLLTLVPFANYSASLTILEAALMQLDEVAANVVAVGAVLDSLNLQLTECQRQNPSPQPPPPDPTPVMVVKTSGCTVTKNPGGGAADIRISAPCLVAVQGNVVVQVGAHAPEVGMALLNMAMQNAGTAPTSCEQLSVRPPVPLSTTLAQIPRGMTNLGGFVGYLGCLYRAVPDDGFPADGVGVAWFGSAGQAAQAYEAIAAVLP